MGQSAKLDVAVLRWRSISRSGGLGWRGRGAWRWRQGYHRRRQRQRRRGARRRRVGGSVDDGARECRRRRVGMDRFDGVQQVLGSDGARVGEIHRLGHTDDLGEVLGGNHHAGHHGLDRLVVHQAREIVDQRLTLVGREQQARANDASLQMRQRVLNLALDEDAVDRQHCQHVRDGDAGAGHESDRQRRDEASRHGGGRNVGRRQDTQRAQRREAQEHRVQVRHVADEHEDAREQNHEHHHGLDARDRALLVRREDGPKVPQAEAHLANEPRVMLILAIEPSTACLQPLVQREMSRRRRRHHEEPHDVASRRQQQSYELNQRMMVALQH